MKPSSSSVSVELKNIVPFVKEELDYLKKILEKRKQLNPQEDSLLEIFKEIPLVDENKYSCPYSELIKNKKFGMQERIIMILALLPHVFPNMIDSAEKQPSGFGGVKGKQHKSFIPTGETLMFIFGDNDIEQRFRLLQLFGKEHSFYTNQLVFLEKPPANEPELSGRLTPSKDLIDLVTKGEIRKPDLSPDFPAKLITTEMEWDDLVVPTHCQQQLLELEHWINFSEELRSDKKLGNKTKPGFKALFYGPPGTGKTLAATLIGKKTERDVYRIDLSTLVSKYIGETEKNLKKLFDRAERKDWILFFDEADAIFGKRTNVSDSHDRYANQEVSYLLQRIEYFDGMVILASNMKNNIDQAFMRRFQSIVHFPVPKADERYKLWESTLPEKVKLDENVDLKKIAEDHKLTGAHIVNVISHCSLNAIANGTKTLTKSMIRNSISRELSKEGRTL